MLRANTLHLQTATHGTGTSTEISEAVDKIDQTYRDPLVGLALGSSFSAVDSVPSSFRGFFLLSPTGPFDTEDAGRFPFM